MRSVTDERDSRERDEMRTEDERARCGIVHARAVHGAKRHTAKTPLFTFTQNVTSPPHSMIYITHHVYMSVGVRF